MLRRFHGTLSRDRFKGRTLKFFGLELELVWVDNLTGLIAAVLSKDKGRKELWAIRCKTVFENQK